MAYRGRDPLARTGEPIMKRCSSEPLNKFGSYQRMWELRLQPESINIYPSQFAATDIKMRDKNSAQYQSYETLKGHRVKHARCPFHCSDTFQKAYATSHEYGWHYNKAQKPALWYPISSSPMTKFYDNLTQTGIKLNKK
mmetsp:Transcript_19868/g.50115  ORF Transcript_19868/g.50115 Transcript_19868/m.50115 type:complete len:139 (+) Transcript_19868:311-727(+)|eukprot:CAMPEP_0178988264 /NCGR_PEP_ID=MMETSP0795-20121207/3718_1 /TAXON_ID=88552 /ORGANISM="Amoebophrya sp., Strain Ameob2" /LENGTH=138 /DNA_ID=CAMNT_0020679527 /DNA_START=408 /DNA_END=824 /DNA_ORIENTATION=-